MKKILNGRYSPACNAIGVNYWGFFCLFSYTVCSPYVSYEYRIAFGVLFVLGCLLSGIAGSAKEDQDKFSLGCGVKDPQWRPEEGQIYFVADPARERFYDYWTWENAPWQQEQLRRGLCHPAKEEAIVQAREMLRASQ